MVHFFYADKLFIIWDKFITDYLITALHYT